MMGLYQVGLRSQLSRKGPASGSRKVFEYCETQSSYLKFDSNTYNELERVIPQTWMEERGIVLSITANSLAAVIRHFTLPEKCIDLLVELTLPACIYPTVKKGRDSSGLLMFNGSSNLTGSRFFKLALKYAPENNFTYGILLLDNDTLPDLLSWGKSPHSDTETCLLPFLLPIYVIGENLKQGRRGIVGQDSRVNRIQEATGQFLPTENYPLPQIDLQKLDYTDLTRQLNFSGDVTSSQIFLLKGLSAALKVLGNWNTMLASCHSEGRERETVSQGQSLVRQKLEYIQAGIDAALMHGEHVQRRTEAFRQLVYQLMAQKDSHTNITIATSSAEIAKASKEDSAVMRQIALDTKRDSSAMKTIATLTMFFLPGTFIAAIFAMPVLEWGDSRTPTIKNGFKQYWIVTLPLTLLVCILWAAVIFLPWRSWLTSGKDEKPKKTLQQQNSDNNRPRRRSCLGYLGWMIGFICGSILGTRSRREKRGDEEGVRPQVGMKDEVRANDGVRINDDQER
ncbi:hypothetical protein ONS95_003517 [Cadophora gregata]|uniref:uncharacterized protein n=1 Tax=Cadophora gregata TaxID=51156 RepID=UPI0026DCAF73|nr:uncharacterized protein ONS95_003517 [Cadophora gregata]KAK0099413.1 hypothetical protein ONS96_008440 [Cadophora gregata f. sp. sojae]KAK0106794.1 hypothetical protein ONS95_003517 [Cadophora gregata]